MDMHLMPKFEVTIKSAEFYKVTLDAEDIDSAGYIARDTITDLVDIMTPIEDSGQVYVYDVDEMVDTNEQG